jgi:ubiquinone/menaquinone biosynthesis C-methylase UbiE
MVIVRDAVMAKTKSIDRFTVEKMPAHWLMAGLGKKVLRPGGVEMTKWLLENSEVKTTDKVIEFAPGLGITSYRILNLKPRTYTAIEQDESAVSHTKNMLARAGFKNAKVLWGDAAQVPLPDYSATIIIGEAMLSMQTPVHRQAILAEARRLLRPGGLYAIQELAIIPDGIESYHKKRIQKDISRAIRVGVNIGTVSEWRTWLRESGFDVYKVTVVPMRLLEPKRLVRDEGLSGTLRFIFNTLKTPGALNRIKNIRSVFHMHAKHLCAVAIIAN